MLSEFSQTNLRFTNQKQRSQTREVPGEGINKPNHNGMDGHVLNKLHLFYAIPKQSEGRRKLKRPSRNIQFLRDRRSRNVTLIRLMMNKISHFMEKRSCLPSEYESEASLCFRFPPDKRISGNLSGCDSSEIIISNDHK